MSVPNTKGNRIKGENIMQLDDVDFYDAIALKKVLTTAGVIKSPGASLEDIQKAVLNLYSPRPLQSFCQYLSPDCLIHEEKKNDLIPIILQRLAERYINQDAALVTPVKSFSSKKLPPSIAVEKKRGFSKQRSHLHDRFCSLHHY